MTSAPPLPPIVSTQLRKRVFTHVSLFRLPTKELDQIENVDNDRLSFLGRAAIDYILSATSVPDVDAQLSALARSYDIPQYLHTTWREPDPDPRATETQLMEAYVGALMLENEEQGIQFAKELVVAMGGQIPEPISQQHNDGAPVVQPAGVETTGQLHDLAARYGIVLSWDDRAEGPKHAQQWTSDVTLQDKKTTQTWPRITRGMGKSKKLARADAAAKMLLQWNDIIQ